MARGSSGDLLWVGLAVGGLIVAGALYRSWQKDVEHGVENYVETAGRRLEEQTQQWQSEMKRQEALRAAGGILKRMHTELLEPTEVEQALGASGVEKEVAKRDNSMGITVRFVADGGLSEVFSYRADRIAGLREDYDLQKQAATKAAKSVKTIPELGWSAFACELSDPAKGDGCIVFFWNEKHHLRIRAGGFGVSADKALKLAQKMDARLPKAEPKPEEEEAGEQATEEATEE